MSKGATATIVLSHWKKIISLFHKCTLFRIWIWGFVVFGLPRSGSVSICYRSEPFFFSAPLSCQINIVMFCFFVANRKKIRRYYSETSVLIPVLLPLSTNTFTFWSPVHLIGLQMKTILYLMCIGKIVLAHNRWKTKKNLDSDPNSNPDSDPDHYREDTDPYKSLTDPGHWI